MKKPYRFKLCQGNEIFFRRYKTAEGLLNHLNKHPKLWLDCTVFDIEKNYLYSINEFIEVEIEKQKTMKRSVKYFKDKTKINISVNKFVNDVTL